MLGNDFDADGDRLNAILVSGPPHGQLWLTYNGSFTYTPTTGYQGPDSFSYRLTDGALTSDPVIVSINVGKVVTVQKIADATEGGSDGTFRFTCTGDLGTSDVKISAVK